VLALPNKGCKCNASEAVFHVEFVKKIGRPQGTGPSPGTTAERPRPGAGFLRAAGVPDTMDGRFDMVALHAWAALAQLKDMGRDDAAQALTDALFTGFDEALREQGSATWAWAGA